MLTTDRRPSETTFVTRSCIPRVVTDSPVFPTELFPKWQPNRRTRGEIRADQEKTFRATRFSDQRRFYYKCFFVLVVCCFTSLCLFVFLHVLLQRCMV